MLANANNIPLVLLRRDRERKQAEARRRQAKREKELYGDNVAERQVDIMEAGNKINISSSDSQTIDLQNDEDPLPKRSKYFDDSEEDFDDILFQVKKTPQSPIPSEGTQNNELTENFLKKSSTVDAKTTTTHDDLVSEDQYKVHNQSKAKKTKVKAQAQSQNTQTKGKGKTKKKVSGIAQWGLAFQDQFEGEISTEQSHDFHLHDYKPLPSDPSIEKCTICGQQMEFMTL